MYMQASQRMVRHGKFLSFLHEKIFCITGLMHTGPLHIVPTRGKEVDVELGMDKSKSEG